MPAYRMAKSYTIFRLAQAAIIGLVFLYGVGVLRNVELNLISALSYFFSFASVGAAATLPEIVRTYGVGVINNRIKFYLKTHLIVALIILAYLSYIEEVGVAKYYVILILILRNFSALIELVWIGLQIPDRLTFYRNIIIIITAFFYMFIQGVNGKSESILLFLLIYLSLDFIITAGLLLYKKRNMPHKKIVYSNGKFELEGLLSATGTALIFSAPVLILIRMGNIDLGADLAVMIQIVNVALIPVVSFTSSSYHFLFEDVFKIGMKPNIIAISRICHPILFGWVVLIIGFLGLGFLRNNFTNIFFLLSFSTCLYIGFSLVTVLAYFQRRMMVDYTGATIIGLSLLFIPLALYLYNSNFLFVLTFVLFYSILYPLLTFSFTWRTGLKKCV